jgi:hypothetical protein
VYTVAISGRTSSSDLNKEGSSARLLLQIGLLENISTNLCEEIRIY